MTLFKLAWRNLFRNPRRTWASLLTVALGAAGLLTYQGFNSGIMNQYRENTIRGYYGHGQIFSQGYYGKVKERPWESWIEPSATLKKELESVPGVKSVYPRVGFFAFLVKNGTTLGGKGEGIDYSTENLFFNQMNVIAGRELQSDEEIILGKGLADSLGVMPGDTLTLLMQTVDGQLNGADLTVAGVFHMGQKSIDDTFFRIGLKQAQALLNTERIEMYSMANISVESWPVVQSALKEKFPQLEAVPFEILDKAYYQNSVDFLNAQFSFIRSILLVIVALGIFNTISVGLMERSSEVGALRANGETRARLWKILLLENAALGFLGGMIGIVLAVVVDKAVLFNGIPMPPGPGITRSFVILLEMQPLHFVQALLLPLLTTVVASTWPIHKLLIKKIPDLLRSV